MNTADSPTSLSLAFSQPEDRLLVLVNGPTGQQDALFLTRRLTALLINGAAGLLARSSAMASKATEEVRNEVLLMEHQGALPEDASPNRKPDASSHVGDTVNESLKLSPQLVNNINIKTNPKSFQIIMKTKKASSVSIILNRRDLHRVLELLKKISENAGWNLQIDATWLDTDRTQLTLH
jgi:hypothetical protein